MLLIGWQFLEQTNKQTKESNKKTLKLYHNMKDGDALNSNAISEKLFMIICFLWSTNRPHFHCFSAVPLSMFFPIQTIANNKLLVLST